jgi:hypothetical protein
MGSPKFACEGCKRNYTWKPEIAGKRVKCKCGQVLTVPQKIEAPAEAEADDLYALAEDADKAAAQPSRLVAAAAALPPPKPVGATATGVSKSGIPLAYKRGPSAREVELAVAAGLDMQRDIYAPLAFMVTGFILYISFYVAQFNMGPNGIFLMGIGLSIMTVLEVAFLTAFALVIAGPLGVGFGDFRTAILKLAAIVIFNDGIITWVDALFAKYAGGVGAGGLFGFGVVGLPIAAGIYWSLFIYLFSMDPGDSWLVVVILTVVYRIFRWILIFMLLAMVLNWGGVRSGAISTMAAGNPAPSPQTTEIDDLKQRGLLKEARQYITDGHQYVIKDVVDEWYADGCPNVWFQVSRDINGKGGPVGLIVELPKDKAKRAKAYETLKSYYKAESMGSDPEDFVDNGDPYLELELR